MTATENEITEEAVNAAALDALVKRYSAQIEKGGGNLSEESKKALLSVQPRGERSSA
jgi:hypothetical protein